MNPTKSNLSTKGLSECCCIQLYSSVDRPPSFLPPPSHTAYTPHDTHGGPFIYLINIRASQVAGLLLFSFFLLSLLLPPGLCSFVPPHTHTCNCTTYLTTHDYLLTTLLAKLTLTLVPCDNQMKERSYPS